MVKKHHLIRDLIVVVFSVIVTLILVKNGTIPDILQNLKEIKFLAGFIGGIFFVSMFTVVPATALLIGAMQEGSTVYVAFFAALGALAGEMIIFRFARDNVSKSLAEHIKSRREKRLARVMRSPLSKWLEGILGALIIISPLPDELGIMMMGLSGIKTYVFLPITLILNFLGIALIGLIANK